jgi:hypothetical protein
MRKTVDEWLGSHQNGMGMAKNKIGNKKWVVRASPSKAATRAKKKLAKKKRKRKPR